MDNNNLNNIINSVIQYISDIANQIEPDVNDSLIIRPCLICGVIYVIRGNIDNFLCNRCVYEQQLND